MLTRVSRTVIRTAIPPLTARTFSASQPHSSRRLLCIAAATAVAATGLYISNSSLASAAASSPPSAVLSFGLGLSGQLGNGDTRSSAIPVTVTPPSTMQSSSASPSPPQFSRIAAGGNTSAAIDAFGRVFTWGHGGNDGKLGLGDAHRGYIPTPFPVDVRDENDQQQQISKVCVGGDFMACVTSQGYVYAWGQGFRGQLGIPGTATNSRLKQNLRAERFDASVPQPVSLPPPSLSRPARVPVPAPVVDIACGAAHTLAVGRDGSLYVWGSNSSGQLGIGSRTSFSPTPVQITIPNGDKAVAVAAGTDFSLVLTDSGRVFSCGDDMYGQLGRGSGSCSPSLSPISELHGVTSVSAGEFHAVAINAQGGMYAWGYNKDGQLGNGSTSNSPRPCRVPIPSPVRFVVCGGEHTAAITGGGAESSGSATQLYLWGRGREGQLGCGSDLRSSPVAWRSSPVPWSSYALPPSTSVASVACGKDHTLLLLQSTS